MKKRILAAVLTAVMAMGALTGCGSTGSKDNYTIGIMQYAVHGSLDNCREGFLQGLAEEGIVEGENLTIEYVNAQADNGTSAMTASNFVSKKVDMICAIATPCAMAAYNATMNTDIPVIYTAVSDPVEAGLANEDGTPVGNITGTSDLAPLDQQEAMIKELVPDVTQVGIVYCSAEANSVFQANQIEAALEKDGIAYKEYSAADSNEIQSVVTKAVSECDCLYVPTDNTMAANVDIIKNVTVPAGIPVIAGEEGICQGALATLSISYYDIGQAAGEMAYEILVNGKDPGTMEIEYASATTKEYNADVADALGITIPDDYVKLSTEE